MVVAVDLGGTNIRAGRLNHDRIVVHKETTLKDKEHLQSTLDQLIELIRSVMDSNVTGIGIGVPSVVDIESGIVYDVTNIPSWKKVELKSILESEFGLPVRVNNDVNCFILGEHTYGVARGFRSVVGLTMGTGLGGGIIINNALYAGHNCGAGEFGLIPYLDENIEAYCSGGFFKKKLNITAFEAFQNAVNGDQTALESWETFGKHLAHAVKTVVYAYDPEAIVLGGSLVNGYPFFAGSMNAAMLDFAFPESMKRLKVVVSQNTNIALLGAASLIS